MRGGPRTNPVRGRQNVPLTLPTCCPRAGNHPWGRAGAARVGAAAASTPQGHGPSRSPRNAAPGSAGTQKTGVSRGSSLLVDMGTTSPSAEAGGVRTRRWQLDAKPCPSPSRSTRQNTGRPGNPVTRVCPHGRHSRAALSSAPRGQRQKPGEPKEGDSEERDRERAGSQIRRVGVESAVCPHLPGWRCPMGTKGQETRHKRAPARTSWRAGEDAPPCPGCSPRPGRVPHH